MTTDTQKLLINYTEHRDDLIKDGKIQQLEITGEVYEEPIHKGANGISDIFTWVFLAEIIDGQRHEAGHKYFEGKLTEHELREEVKYAKENPFDFMYHEFATNYQR
jgi:hypothetical protein